MQSSIQLVLETDRYFNSLVYVCFLHVEQVTSFDRNGLLMSVETDELVEGQQRNQGDRG